MRRVLLAFLLLLPFQAARGESLWQTLPAVSLAIWAGIAWVLIERIG